MVKDLAKNNLAWRRESRKKMTFHERLLEFDAVRELVAARCVSELGRRRVAELAPSADMPTLSHAISLTKEMMALLAGRKEPPIFGLRDVAAHLKKVARERSILEPAELLDVREFGATAGRMRAFFEPLQNDAPGLHSLAMPLYHTPALIRSIDEKIAPNTTVRDTASELLQRLRVEILQVEQGIQRVLNRMVTQFFDSGDLQDNFFTLRNDRYVLPVKSNNRGKVRGIIHDSSNTGETVFIEPFEILEMSNKLADLRLSEREEIYRILLRLASEVRAELNVLITDLEILSEFDLIYAKSRFGIAPGALARAAAPAQANAPARPVLPCAFPAITGIDRPLHLADAHHPLLYANDPASSRPLQLGLDAKDRVLIITGPNAGGKTTALKTVGLTALMVQCAIPVPLSPKSRIPVFKDVLADIGDEQSILEGYSTFSARMHRMTGILRESGEASLVLLDELGAATDPGEGGALAVAILESLAERGTLAMVSTHLAVLKNWAFGYEHGRNASFRLSEKDHRPTFYLFMDVPGISEALVIAEQVGLPADVIQRARGLRPQTELDATALLLSLQEKEQKLAEQIEAAERLQWELDEKKAEVERIGAQLREDKRKYRAQMLAEKEKTVSEMRAQVEALIAKLPSKQQLVEARHELEQQAAAAKAEKEEVRRQPEGFHGGQLKPGVRVLVRTLNEVGTIVELVPKRGEAKVAVKRMVVAAKLGDLAVPDPEKLVEHEDIGVHYHRPTGEMPVSLDLHGNRVEEALDRVDKFIDQALAAGLGYVRLVHGQGSGALRRAIHQHLRGVAIVKNCRFGTPNEGGGSVTIVEFQ